MRIFISYARQDSDVIESVRKAIERVGHVVWVDRRLQGGQAWWDVILSEIRACDAFMLALSPDSARSKACGCELAYATETRRHLLPIMVRDVDPRLFSEKIADFQYVDYRQQTVDNTLDIISSLSRIPPAATLPDPLPAPPTVPITYLDEFSKILKSESLSLNDQMTVLGNLRVRMLDKDDRETIKGLLLELGQRNDITVAVAKDIERLLNETSSPGPEPKRTEPTVSEAPRQRGPEKTATATMGPPPPASSGGNPRRFNAPGVDTRLLATRLTNWFESERLETQIFEDGDGVVVQCKSAQKWRRILGAGVAFTVRMWTKDSDLVVELGHAQWKDKAAAAAVGAFLFFPALITAAWGATEQHSLAQQAIRLIDRSIPECTKG